MKIADIASKTLAVVALLLLLYGFVVPSIGFHGVLNKISDNRVEDISPLSHKIWNFYQKSGYISINTPKEAKNDLSQMIDISAEIGVCSLPLWNFSLEAPNYPKEAFPSGLPVFIHFDGLSGEVHEMNTINHYVGMAPMQRGGIYEKALAPYALIALAILLSLFIIYNNKWIDRAMIIPVVLPLVFIAIYGYWLYWFGHNLEGGAISIKPFMPVILGDGKVAQFTTHAYPVVGFWVLVVISVLMLISCILKVKASKDKPYKTSYIQHFLALVVLVIGLVGSYYVLQVDIKTDTIGKIKTIIGGSKAKIIDNVVEVTPSKEDIQKQFDEETKEQQLKVRALEQKAGSLSKFKVSRLYKQGCASCHGVNGEGSIGLALVGMKKDELLSKMDKLREQKDEMHIATITKLSEEQIEQIVDEISEFEHR